MKHELTANRLKMAMEKAGIKAYQLADRSGVSQASISQYLSGSHKPSNVSSGKMADILGVNPVWLMGFDAPMIKLELSANEKDLIRGIEKIQRSLRRDYYNQEFLPAENNFVSKLFPCYDKILPFISQLNEEGQEKLLDYAQDLVQSGRYKKNNKIKMVD